MRIWLLSYIRNFRFYLFIIFGGEKCSVIAARLEHVIKESFHLLTNKMFYLFVFLCEQNLIQKNANSSKSFKSRFYFILIFVFF